MVDCKVEVDTTSDVSILTKTTSYKVSPQEYLDMYPLNALGDNKILLYKSVTPDHTDFYTKKIKYEGTVICPDWDSNFERQCGGGFHLSPTPEQALSYNTGIVLRCSVDLKDFVVYKDDLSKVRCKKVTVLGVEGG